MQVLSIAVAIPGTTVEGIMSTFSSKRQPFKVGDKVVVIGNRRLSEKEWAAKVTSVNDTNKTAKLVGVDGDFDEERVWHEGAVRCTQGAVTEAKRHSKSKGVGAQVPKQINGHSGIGATRAAKVASFL